MLIAFAGGKRPVAGRTRLHQLVYALQRELEPSFADAYQFENAETGPYSRSLQEDLDELIGRGLLTELKERDAAGRMNFGYSASAAGAAFLERVLADRPLAQKHRLQKALALADKVKASQGRLAIGDLAQDLQRRKT